MPGNIFRLCDENGENRPSCDNWNDQRKTRHGENSEKMLDRLTKWLNVGQVIDALKATRH